MITTSLQAVHDHGHEHEPLWDSYVEIMTDPGHILAEFTFTLFDILVLSPFLFILWKLFTHWVKKMLAKEHSRLDKEHGIAHTDQADDIPHCESCTCGSTKDNSSVTTQRADAQGRTCADN